MRESPSPFSPSEAIEAAAAAWAARRDRGLRAPEQAAYAAWLREDPRHEATVARLEKAWQALDALSEHPAALVIPPNPDLLARRHHSRWIWRWSSLTLAAAAAVAALLYFPRSSPPEITGPRQLIVHPGPRQLNLEDGSVVELNGDAKVELNFTAAERRVRLVSGEAFFSVAKNPHRPFIVTVNHVAVNAVGTAFSVRWVPQEISVLVTEGRVRVDDVPPVAGEKSGEPRELSTLDAGQQGIIPFATPPQAAGTVMTVQTLSPPQLDSALSWRGLRLEFISMPLGEVVAEFNRYNPKKLVVHDAATASIRVGGTFRADNVDAFIRLLDAGFGVSAFPMRGEIVLRKTHEP